MSSNPVRLQLLLQKYIGNTADKAELEAFWHLMSELSDNDLVQLGLQDLWSRKQDADAAAEADWNKVYHMLQQKIATHEFNYAHRMHSVKRRKYFYAAAAAAVLVCIATLTWKLSFNKSIPVQKGSIAAITKPGRHQTISLPDGTMVTLNEGSKLDYPVAFNQSTRDVYLTGEAFFDVKHNADKPFLVHTGSLITKVLGTAFNIRAYPGDANVSVTVERGRVQVQADNNKKALGILSAGEQLVIDKVSADVNFIKADVQKVVAWKATDMIFDNSTVDEAVIALGNRYGVTFRFENEALRKCRFTANFANDSLNQSLDVICTLINAHWLRRDGSEIIDLKGKGCE